MKRLTAILFAAAALAAPAAACAQLGQGSIERIESKVDQVLQLLQKGVPPVVPPTVDPVPPGPTVPPATSSPNCNYEGPYLINGQGTVRNVCTCSPMAVQVTNAIPGATMSWSKMPGTGLPSVPLGMVTVTEGGRVVNMGGTGSSFGIGLGDRSFVFSSEVRCTNLVVQVR